MSSTQSQTVSSSIQICRVMTPDEANPLGIIFGGSILKMIEEAGCLISTRHCNTEPGEQCVTALARVERTDFLYPMTAGDEAHVSAAITSTSKDALEVLVTVTAENTLTGKKKLTNKATLWYVPISKNLDKIIEVPPIEYATPEEEERGRRRYESQEMERMEMEEKEGDMLIPGPDPEPYTVGFSQSSVIRAVMPADCVPSGFLNRGVALGLIDEVAGIVATRHCKTAIATASVDAVHFQRDIKKGHVVLVTGRVTFTSSRSMEIEVFVHGDDLLVTKGKYRSATALLTCLALDMKKGTALPMTPLKVETEEEQKRFEEGKTRYLQNKAKRQAEREGQQ